MSKERLIINNKVRKLRFEHNEMTQKELAQRVGVSRQTIVAIEKGQYSPTLELCFKIARELNTTIDDVFYVED